MRQNVLNKVLAFADDDNFLRAKLSSNSELFVSTSETMTEDSVTYKLS